MLNRLIQKKWYKYQQAKKAKTFDSHWYMRFGWLEQPFTTLEQLDSLFEIHSPGKFTFADSFYAHENGRHFIFFEEVDDHGLSFSFRSL